MRIAYIMYPSGTDLLTCSTYSWAKLFFKRATERGHYVYWFLPMQYLDRVLEKEPEFVKNPRIKLIDITPEGGARKAYLHLSSLSAEVLEKLALSFPGTLFYDAIITDRTLASGYLKQFLWSTCVDAFGKRDRPPVYNMQQYVFSPKNSSSPVQDEHFEMMQAVGMVDCYNVFVGPWEAQMALQTARKHLSPATLRKACNAENTLLGLTAVSCTRLQQYRRSWEQRKANKVFTLNFAQTESEIYKYEQQLVTVARMFAIGRRVEFLITSAGGENAPSPPKHLLERVGVEAYRGLPQTDFFEKIQKAHAFISPPREGETSFSNLEQLYLGLVGIFPNKGWCRAVLPEGYPWIYSTQAELEVLVRELQEHYWTDDRIPVWLEKCKQRIEELFDADIRSEALLHHIEQAVQSRIDGAVYPNYTESLDRIPDTCQGLTYEQWYAWVKEQSETGLRLDKLVSRVNRSRLAFYWYMKKLGWADACDAEQPRWERVNE